MCASNAAMRGRFNLLTLMAVTPFLAFRATAAASGECSGAADAGDRRFQAQTIHQAGAPILLLAAGEIDAVHAGPELLAVRSDGVILRLEAGEPGWDVRPLPITVEPGALMAVRPTINIGDVNVGVPGNEIVIETFNTVSVLAQVSPGNWQRQIVLDGDIFFGNTWGVRIGDIDPAHPGSELFYITESAGDVSAGFFAKLTGGQWQSQDVFEGEVGMDSAIGDSNPAHAGDEIVVGTEMGPVYEITPQPGDPSRWPRQTLWNDFDNAPWTLRIADVLPNLPGNEIAYGSRYSDSLLLSRRSGGVHEMQVVFTGQATEAMTMWDIAVGDVEPASASLEIVGVDDLGLAYLAQYDGSTWSGRPLWQDPNGALYAAVLADFLTSPGLEIVVAGESGAITVISRHEPCLADIAPPRGAGGGNGVVDVDDLFAVINSWGDCPDGGPCPADIAPAGPPQGDGAVDVDDLFAIVNSWGACP